MWKYIHRHLTYVCMTFIKVSNTYQKIYILVIRNFRENISCQFTNLKLKNVKKTQILPVPLMSSTESMIHEMCVVVKLDKLDFEMARSRLIKTNCNSLTRSHFYWLFYKEEKLLDIVYTLYIWYLSHGVKLCRHQLARLSWLYYR